MNFEFIEADLAAKKVAHTFILMGDLSYEKIAEGTELSIEEVQKLAENEKR